MSQADYYDDFADRGVREGINARHRAIDRWLERFGLQQNMDVLKIGCGVGTQTELIAKRLAGSGRLTGIDLSPRSVELARARVSRWPNVRLIAGDVVELDLDETFDVVVLPDVIEHIPVDHIRGFSRTFAAGFETQDGRWFTCPTRSISTGASRSGRTLSRRSINRSSSKSYSPTHSRTICSFTILRPMRFGSLSATTRSSCCGRCRGIWSSAPSAGPRPIGAREARAGVAPDPRCQPLTDRSRPSVATATPDPPPRAPHLGPARVRAPQGLSRDMPQRA